MNEKGLGFERNYFKFSKIQVLKKPISWLQ